MPDFQTQGPSRADNLFAGEYPRAVTATVTIKEGEDLVRGAVLGKDGDDKFLLSLDAAEDGSGDPYAILLEDVHADGADAEAVVLLEGMVNHHALTYGTGHDLDSVLWPLRELGIHVRENVEVA